MSLCMANEARGYLRGMDYYQLLRCNLEQQCIVGLLFLVCLGSVVVVIVLLSFTLYYRAIICRNYQREGDPGGGGPNEGH